MPPFASPPSRARRAPPALALGLLLACGCVRVPGYARPHGTVMAASQVEIGDGIRYRPLAQDDFRASAPSGEYAGHERDLGAYTCAYLMPGEAYGQIVMTPDAASGTYSAKLAVVDIHAVMDRSCSWWNPTSRLASAYILEHEQVHFAIVELAARGLDAQVRGIRGVGSSPREAAADLQQRVEAAVRAATEAMLERNTRFDSEASGGYHPEAQTRWREQVEAELADR